MKRLNPRPRPAVHFVIFAATLGLAAAPLFAADRLRAGEWEFTTTRAGAEPNTFKHCVTPEEALMANGDTKTARGAAEKKSAGKCAITAYSTAGNAVSYAMTCGKVSLRSKATYTGDTSQGELVSKAEGAPEVVSHIKARRIGDCP
ncbi:MAG: DUF3617 family protein [Acidobacteriota bacterium]